MNKTLQDQLFEDVLAKFPKKSIAVEELSNLFGVGKDAVYRRLRGDTLLAPDELAALAQKFNLSLDAYVFEDANTVFCSFNPFTKEIKNVSDYLEGIHKLMGKVQHLPNTSMYYATSDVPLFVYFYFPEILQFKIYIWGRAVWMFDYLDDMKFNFNVIGPHGMEMAQDMLKYYVKLPSTELWSTDILDNTLNQIEYHVNSGHFSNLEDAMTLCKRLDDLANHMETTAKLGYKFLPNQSQEIKGGEIKLYHNEMVYSNNTILFDTVAGKAVYSSYTNPNFLKINDQRMCDFTHSFFEKIKSKSILMSVQGEKQRSWYFNRMRKKIELTKTRISLQMEAF